MKVRSIVGARAIAAGMMMLGSLGAAAPARLDIAVTGLRSAKGLIQACITADAKTFPNCDKDPAARHLSVAVDKAGDLRFDDLPSGSYAVALFHDENGNGKLDTRLGVPLEGIGFSNNPRLWFGPPSFAQARLALPAGTSVTTVKLKYFF